jgi:Rhodanese-related sulfurtransferase
MKRFITVVLLCFLMVAEAAIPAYAAEQDWIRLGEECLSSTPPDYENAALYFRRAGANGDAEGYYRLAGLYEQGHLAAGDPCTDDIETIGREEARKYYAIAAQRGYGPAREKLAGAWQSISQEEAKRLMREEPACIVLDVRTMEEYDAGHIPGAICIPVETIAAPPQMLQDFDQMILVYCRSGRRSKQAAEKLAEMGYTDIREFGGILDWTGDIASAEEDSLFTAFTGLSRMAAAVNEGAEIEKKYTIPRDTVFQIPHSPRPSLWR